jgi:hypothetical protein
MASISQAQASLGADFDFGGIARGEQAVLTGVDQIMAEAALQFIQLAKKRLTQRKKIDTGNMSDIQVSETKRSGSSFSITIGYDKSNPASEYYDFNDKGVKGIGNARGNKRNFYEPKDSPYSFKNLRLSNSFISSIMQWYLRHKNYIKKEDQKRSLTGLQRKRRSLGNIANKTEDLRSLAINTAKNIKRKGISRTGFFQDNIEIAFGQEFQEKIALALGINIALTIKQSFK